MKNIHLIPTNKPSRLYYNNNDLELQFCELCKETTPLKENRNIYITSDEEIKEGDWCLDIKRNIIFQSKRSEIGTSKKIPIIICTYEGCYIQKDCKKIILTTNQLLDGVQAIDDEFLEWFVKNPNCEEVKVEGHIYKGQDETEYKIIFPKEEQKQHLIDMMKADEELGLYEEPKQEITLEEVFNEEKAKGVRELIDKHKQKTTPEEVAEYLGFVKGVKWQMERSYSEEEVLQLLNNLRLDSYNHGMGKIEFLEWFEQFKKK